MEANSLTKREYLRSLGFNVGERGRLTPAMITALKDYQGPQNTVTVYDVEMVPISVDYASNFDPIVREPRVLTGRDKEGNVISFTTCNSCQKHMSFCSCQMGVFAPIMVVSTSDKEVYVN